MAYFFTKVHCFWRAKCVQFEAIYSIDKLNNTKKRFLFP